MTTLCEQLSVASTQLEFPYIGETPIHETNHETNQEYGQEVLQKIDDLLTDLKTKFPDRSKKLYSGKSLLKIVQSNLIRLFQSEDQSLISVVKNLRGYAEMLIKNQRWSDLENLDQNWDEISEEQLQTRKISLLREKVFLAAELIEFGLLTEEEIVQNKVYGQTREDLLLLIRNYDQIHNYVEWIPDVQEAVNRLIDLSEINQILQLNLANSEGYLTEKVKKLNNQLEQEYYQARRNNPPQKIYGAHYRVVYVWGHVDHFDDLSTIAYYPDDDCYSFDEY